MDYFDEYDDSRPRYLFRGGGGGSSISDSSHDTTAVSKTHLAVCFSASFLLSLGAFYAFQLSYDTLFTLLIWFSLSLLLAPFAPSSATGGSVCVGGGPALPEPAPPVSNADAADSSSNGGRRSRSRKQVDRSVNEAVTARSSTDQSLDQKRSEQKALEEKRRGEEKKEKEEEKDWTDEDFDLLKKQMTKYPVAGDPNRWEKIASAFKGRHSLDSVIRTAKLVQEMKARGENPFEQFLKKRKPVDPRAEAANSEVVESKAELKEIWSSGDDLALLNALKAFPKDVSMRWEKIAAAVPGKSKAGCMRRVSELKKDFRSMKASDL